jgi:RNA polymerase sigma-70 factor, ECF subfamily
VHGDEVVAAARRGERWAFTELFRAYQPGLLRFLRGQEPGAADDLAGEVWVAVARGLDRFVGDERAFRCWVFAIARNRLADHRRTAARRRTAPLQPKDLESYVDLGAVPDPADVVVGARSAQDAIDALVVILSPSQAEVVLLRIVGGLDVAEVASITGKSEGSVRVLQHRALRRLGSALTPRTVTK